MINGAEVLIICSSTFVFLHFWEAGDMAAALGAVVGDKDRAARKESATRCPLW